MPDYVYAIIGISLIFVATTLGALLVFVIRKKDISVKLNRIFTGIAAGVMLSASFFGLIKPAFDAGSKNVPIWLVVAIGIVLGALFLWGIDKLVPHFHINENKEEGLQNHYLSRNSKMFLAVTIHNVPEGLSVGIAFGVALATQGNNYPLIMGALLLAVGIGIQNVLEGAAVSLPIKAETGKSGQAFVFGMMSGIVEPIAALIGLFLALQIQVIMPWGLAFAAGCMIYVVAEEMIPELKGDEHDHIGVWSFIIGFVVMMALDCIQF